LVTHALISGDDIVRSVILFMLSIILVVLFLI